MAWKNPFERMEKRMRKRVLLLTVLTLGVALPACRYGPRVYSILEQHRLNHQAAGLLQKDEYTKAALCLRQTLELNPNNIQASRLFAELADKIGKADAVSLRERVCALAPDSFDDAYAWASSALRFGDLTRARAALAIMKRTGENRGGYHETAARIAVELKRPDDAANEYAEALKIEPNNENYQLDAAVLDIQSDDEATREAARKTLDRLRATPAYHHAALRALATAYATRGDYETALRPAKELATDLGANLQDRLIYLGVLRGGGYPLFASYLNEVQASVGSNASEITLLVNWMNLHHLALLSQQWTDTLPQEMISKPPVAIKLAETYILLSEWKRLQTLTSNSVWGDFEYSRLAFLSRALSELGDAAGSDTQWEAAINVAAKRPDKLLVLEKSAATWGWAARYESLLWFVAKNSKRPQEALRSLAEHYRRIGDTRNLYRAVTSLFDLDPTNISLKNNWVMLSLLLRAEVQRAAQAAEELYEANPTDPHAAATYGFALYMTNRTDDALAVMRKLPPDQLHSPSIAAYYGVMLAAVRNPEATKYLDLAKNAQLLPEEEQMLAKARQSLTD